MKKLRFILISLILLSGLLSGCERNPPQQEPEKTFELSKQIIPVVEKYLTASAQNNWPETCRTLTGEALVNAKANMGLVTQKEKIITKKFKVMPVTPEIAEVNVDFIKATPSGLDRAAYKFRLIKDEKEWLIYKIQPGEYLHQKLKPGSLPEGAEKVVREYFELPLEQRQTNSQKYLAGSILRRSKMPGNLPREGRSEINVREKVTSVKCLGTAGDFAITEVNTVVNRNGKTYKVKSIVDLVNISGSWKIARLDVAGID